MRLIAVSLILAGALLSGCLEESITGTYHLQNGKENITLYDDGTFYWTDGKFPNSGIAVRHGNEIILTGQLGTGGKFLIEKGKLVDSDNGNIWIK